VGFSLHTRHAQYPTAELVDGSKAPLNARVAWIRLSPERLAGRALDPFRPQVPATYPEKRVRR